MYIHIYYIHPELRIGNCRFRSGKGAGLFSRRGSIEGARGIIKGAGREQRRAPRAHWGRNRITTRQCRGAVGGSLNGALAFGLTCSCRFQQLEPPRLRLLPPLLFGCSVLVTVFSSLPSAACGLLKTPQVKNYPNSNSLRLSAFHVHSLSLRWLNLSPSQVQRKGQVGKVNDVKTMIGTSEELLHEACSVAFNLWCFNHMISELLKHICLVVSARRSTGEAIIRSVLPAPLWFSDRRQFVWLGLASEPRNATMIRVSIYKSRVSHLGSFLDKCNGGCQHRMVIGRHCTLKPTWPVPT